MATKTQFLDAYEAQLKKRYAWANDENRLAQFMHLVTQTISVDGDNTWNRSGEAYEAALRECNLPARITLKALRALPFD